MEVTFEEQWPHKIWLSGNNSEKTRAFAWLWGRVIDGNLDHRQVFTTYGGFVAFPRQYGRLAAEFKLRFG
jgi:hypothetical protein